MAIPATPANLSIDDIASNCALLSWDNVAGETEFRLYRSLDDVTFILHMVLDADVITLYDYEVAPDTTYYYKISAYNADGESALSASVNDTTLAQDWEEYWLGSRGPLRTDNNAWYQGQEEVIKVTALRASLLHVTGAPTIGDHVLRKDDLGGVYAPGNSSYVVIGLDGSLSQERRLQAGAGLTLTDGGANGDATIGITPVKKEFTIDAVNLDKGSQGPDAVILGHTLGYSYDIGDDSVLSFEVTYDCDTGEDIKIEIYWYIDEAYGTDDGEVQWRVQWSACPADETEAIDAPTHTGTIDMGDQDIPATAKHLTEVSGVIAAASIADGDFISMTVDRVALDGGNNPTADPVIVQIEVEYTLNKLGKAI